jgi:hypothetical protein
MHSENIFPQTHIHIFLTENDFVLSRKRDAHSVQFHFQRSNGCLSREAGGCMIGRNISALAIFAVLVMAREIGFCEAPDRMVCENFTLFYGLWKDAAFGMDPNRTEKAAWVILSPEGSYRFQRWPASGARNGERWRGPVPDHAVALVHTHTVIVDEKPSRKDILTAQKLGMVLYVISSKGIWSIAPNGQEKKQGGPKWQICS